MKFLKTKVLNNLQLATIHVLRKQVKSFLSHKAHRAARISVSSALSQTPVYTARPQLVPSHSVPVYVLLVHIAPTHGGMARLSWHTC